MQKSYTKNYIKIYFWQGISLVLNFVSLFVVIPYLTEDPFTYGIYSVCISFSIFLAYADLGFVTAGQKYAAEYFSVGDKDSEIRVAGFTVFILGVFLLIFSCFFILLSLYPHLLVKGIVSTTQVNIASTLFAILAVFTPITLLQRLTQIIFGIRMEDYIIQRTNIIGNLIKISSIVWFFAGGKYNILGYFLFTQLVNFVSSIFTLFIARKRYGYDFLLLIKSIHFDIEIYNKMKNIAYASLFLTFSWIVFYELDTLVIGKFLGAAEVAIYALGLTVLSFFRSILGVVYSPFSVRFNHFIGTGNEAGLKSFYLSIVSILAPVVIFPTLVISIFARPIVVSWVGVGYSDSVFLIQFFVFCNVFSFISYPTNFMLLAREKQKSLYFLNTILPVIFWGGIISSVFFLGLKSFAIFKFLSFSIAAIYLYSLMIKYLNLSLRDSFRIIFIPILLPMIYLIIASFMIRYFMHFDSNSYNLIHIAIIVFCLLFSSFIILFFTSKVFKAIVLKTMPSIIFIK